MTAEIAVMNRSGIALAADSAATVNFARGAKIFSTNKLFMLSKHYPVGIMIFGNASLVGIPWEILIKEYRNKHLSGRCFPTLLEYGTDFIEYLNGNTFYFTEDIQQEGIYVLFSRLKDVIIKTYEKNVLAKIKEGQEVDLTIFPTVFAETIQAKHDELNSLENLKHFKITENRFNQRFGAWLDVLIDEARKETLVGDAKITPELADLLKRIVYLAVVKNTFENNRDLSGVVIAGYGEKEIYPSLSAYDIEIVVDDKLKYLSTRNIAIDHLNDIYVQPFAQDDMVQTFMRGVSPGYEELVDDLFEAVLTHYPEAVNKKISEFVPDGVMTNQQKEDFTGQLKQLGENYLKYCRDRIEERVKLENKTPIERAVSMLPIEELASMASALVNLTSFKRRVTPVSETVGGAVDVAVITKGDGFIWIDRKHYFEREKNQHFFANYYRGESKNEKQQTTKDGKNGRKRKTR